MVENISIKFFSKADVEMVSTFYETKTAYRNSVSVRGEDKMVAAFAGQEMLGVLRLCEENDVGVLRGFNVQGEFQKQGIGLQILKEAERYMDTRTFYLICKNRLNGLYAKVGFERVSEVPDFLQQRMLKYSNQNLNILKREAGRVNRL